MRAVVVGLILAVAGFAIARGRGMRMERELAVAVLRAGLQLAVVALVVDAVFEHLGYSGLFVLVMVGAATWTAGRRLAGVARPYLIGGTALSAGAAPALLALFGSGAYPLEPRYVIPIAGILIGGAMTAATLAGRRTREELRDKRDEFEARLSLGVSPTFALRSYLPGAVHHALIPVLDQTKNVGLVTLPGAFVGMILGGASPAEAAQVQLTVLFALLGTDALAATLAATLVARSFIRPGDRLEIPGDPVRR